MSRGLKIGLAVGAGVLLLCCIVSVVVYFVVQNTLKNAVTTDPAEAAAIGHEIVDYTLPRGYEEQMAMTILGMKILAIAPTAGGQDPMVLMLMQFPASVQMSREEMERQMRQAWQQQGGKQDQNYTVVGTEEVTIRGGTVTLTVSESKSEDGIVTRQVVGAFPGKDERMVLLMAMGDKDSWDQEALDEFLRSIR